ncbi:hypothetical protein PRtIB026_A31830 [Pseudomonas sp. RtIB026]|nr:hypothetical protein PRtIB026_A31830 [Pseudomonas sp. RtIB026]
MAWGREGWSAQYGRECMVLQPPTCGSGFTRECGSAFTDAFAGKPAPTGNLQGLAAPAESP